MKVLYGCDKFPAAKRLPVRALWWLVLVIVLAGPALSQESLQKHCAVRLAVVASDKPAVERGKRVRHEDTLITLDRNKNTSLEVHLFNEGRIEQFDVRIEPVVGLSVASGGGTRLITVETGESAKLNVVVRGGEVEGRCRWDKRRLRISVRPQEEPDSVVCGFVDKGFFCRSP